MESANPRRLAKELAQNLLQRDGIAVIWLLHLAAAKAHREGQPRAAETLIEIADAAAEWWPLAGTTPRWKWTAPSP